MLRRRIFSSAMASVMALSAVAVVANAEETTNQYKSKADLQGLLADYDDAWRVDILSEYGTEITKSVLNALDTAQAILDKEADPDNEIDEDDFTVAYHMVYEATNNLPAHIEIGQLEELIAAAQAIIDKGNVLNPELLDLKYTPDSFYKLEEALENAKFYQSSTSKADINNAYTILKNAKEALSLMPTVKKSDYRTKLAEYNAIFEHEFDYESWRRGTLPWTTFNLLTGDNSMAWTVCNTDDYVGQAYAAIYGLSTGAKKAITDIYSEIDGIKGLTETSDEEIYDGYLMLLDAIKVYKDWNVDANGRASKSAVSSLLKEFHNQLVYEYAADGTSVDDLYAAIAAVPDMEIQTFGEEGTNNVWHVEKTTVGKDHTVTKIYAEAVVKLKGTSIFVPVDTAGHWIQEDAEGNALDIVTSREAKKPGVTYMAIYESVKFDLADLINVTAADCLAKAENDLDHSEDNIKSLETEVAPDGNTIFGSFYTVPWVDDGTGNWVPDYDGNDWDWECDPVLLSKAMVLAEGYINGKWADPDVAAIFAELDDTSIIRKDGKDVAEGSTTEWALVYRYLNYALRDKYVSKAAPAAAGKAVTKLDIRKLIEQATELVDETGDAAIFRASNVKLDEEIKVAYDWLGMAESDRMYRDNAPGMAADGTGYVASNDAYARLEDYVKLLTAERDALKYEFGQIYQDIADICKGMDNGDYAPTQELIDAVDACAFALANVDTVTYVEADSTVCVGGKYYDNPAFDDVKDFFDINRCVTAKDVEIKELDGKLTDQNSTHFALASAYEAMIKARDAQTAEPEFDNGDADGDDRVTALDAGLILQVAAKMISEEDLKGNGDADGDGRVTALDAAKVLVDLANV